MKKTFHIIRHEIRTTLERPSYLLVTLGLPLLGIIVFGIVTIINNRSPEKSVDHPSQSESSQLDIEGYIDQANLIKSMPPDIPPGQLLPFEDESAAKIALENDEISAYYLIPQDYVETGMLYCIRSNYTPMSPDGQDWIMRWVMLYNLVHENAELASTLWAPMDLQVTDLSIQAPIAGADQDCLRPGYSCESNTFLMLLPTIVVVLFFVFISASAGLLLRSVSAEKQNRTIETILVSTRPTEILSGKIVGLGLVALLQLTLWFGSAFIMIRFGGGTFNLPAGFELPTTLLFWGLLLFIGGYVIYASLMAGLGALVPDIKAATQASFIVLLPLIAGYMVAYLPPVQQVPHGLLATTLSIFPFTAPTVMMMRLTVGGVPTWQLVLTIILLALTVVLVVRAVSGMFRAQTILSGQPFSVKRYLNSLFGRE